MSNIPKAEIYVEIAMGCLREALANMPREKGIPRTKPKSVRMTKAIGGMVRSYKSVNPDASLQEIANHFGVNDGRVSEALNGKWK